MEPEEWRAVAEFPEYAVSNWGRFRRTATSSRGHKPKIVEGHIGSHGYRGVTLWVKGKKFHKLLHRLVCEAFHGTAPTPLHQVAHNDGTRINNRAENLRWATRAENMADSLLHGTRAMGATHGRTVSPERTPRGVQHGHAKLTEAEVLAIRAADGMTGRALAARHSVSPATVSLVRSGKVWRHI